MPLPLILGLGAIGLQGLMAHEQNKANYELGLKQNAEARRAGDREQAINTVNINRAKESQLAESIDIDIASMQARSQAIVAAAAAGTAGMSVDDSILNIERNASKAEFASRRRLSETITALEHNRESIEARVRSNTILSTKPNAALQLFSSALSAADFTYGKTWE